MKSFAFRSFHALRAYAGAKPFVEWLGSSVRDKHAMTQPMNDPSYVLGQILAVLHAEGILAQLDLHTSQDILHLACEAPAQVLLPALQLREKNPGLRSFHEIELPSLGPEVLAASCNSQRFVQGFLNEELALILWCYYGCLAPHRLEDTETFCQAIADRRTP